MIRTGLRFSASLVALAMASAFSVAACSSADVPVGATDQALQNKSDGGPTGNGTTCSWDDAVSSDGATTAAPNGPYKVGDKFPAPDGCNECTCSPEGIYCTERGCAPKPGGTCAYNGKSYGVDDRFPSVDGCNSCGCQADGSVFCTELACAPKDVCTYGGKTYPDGAKFPSVDSCNSCFCSATGGVSGVSCTEIHCPFTCPAQATINCMPVVPPESQALCGGSYHDWIKANCNVQFVY